MPTSPDATKIVKEYTDEQLLVWMKEELEKVKKLKKAVLSTEWNTESYIDLTTDDLVMVKAKYEATRENLITKADCTFDKKSVRIELYIQHYLYQVLSKWVDVTDSFSISTDGSKDLTDEIKAELNKHLLKLYDRLADGWKAEIKAMKVWLKKHKA